MATESGRSKQLGPGILPCKVVCGCAGLPSFPRAPLWVFTMPPTRDPFPRLKSDNDDSYLGKLQASQKLPYKNPTHLAQQQEPWNRLSSTPTVTSMRRDAYFFDPEIPKDDLDFRLAALYDHHIGAFKNKSEILIHQETIQDTYADPPRLCSSVLPNENFHLFQRNHEEPITWRTFTFLNIPHHFPS
ncbi:protein C1orf194 homolog isoform X4 [Rousettus aegyptiacus]|uniref:protein C1orf194 homolog isoform X4 n=1 Tax=Rousettus aegyptiacus TaxID=9407 RepID=UPI00168D4D35|nr:protein C1orf194 homolog isoform X4 [Rousettus aegyptiacus]